MDPAWFQGLRWRCIGPPRGGRVVAVSGHPTEPMVFYFGAVAGGVWKTTDGGTYWENISDGYFRTSAIGALAVAESDPNVIYAGTGEATIRIDVSYGDGVYKTTDGGKTWSHVGLAESRHIGKIQVHPQDPDLVYVAALGHAFGPNDERGVYRSRDGGRTWQKVLFRSERAGAIDLTLDRRNPRVLYASTWEVYRHFWTLSSGGPDSRLYKSADGGDTWTDLTDNPGLPPGIKGKIGVTVSPARPDRVWAIIEAEKAGLYRSDDAGRTWELVSDNRDLIHRPWYYCHVFADPVDPDTVYVTNLGMWKSTDGGRTFTEITTPHGDNHDLWIDPRDPRRMVEGNDGGACVSFNGGQSWSTIYNQLTAQFYHVSIDDQYPYRVYGTQQDNSSVSVPNASENGGITWGDCYPAGTGESGYIVAHPRDPNVVYVGAVGSSPGGGGALQRYDHRTRQIQLVTVWPEVYYGWAWTQSFEVQKDPRVPATQTDLDAQFALWCKIRDTLSETHAGINRLRRIRRQVSEWSQRLRESPPSDGAPLIPGSDGARPVGQEQPGVARPGTIAEAANRLLARLTEIETELIQTSARNSMDALRLPARLNLRLASLVSVLSSADTAPPRQAFLVYEHLAELARRELGRLETLIETDVVEFNTLVREANLPAIATR